MIVLGIDVSKAKLDCCIFLQGVSGKKKNKSINNTAVGFNELEQWLKKHHIEPYQITVVMEATSIYHENLAYYLHELGVKVCIANAARVRAFAKGMSMLNKTDKADSEALARYGYCADLITWQPEPKNVRILKALLNRREVLTEDLQRENNRLEVVQSEHTVQQVVQSIKIHVEQLEQEIVRLEQEISDHVDHDPDLKNDLNLLTTIPSVGKKTGLLMLSLLRSRNFEKASQAAAYVGVIPTHFQSGSSVNKQSRLSKAGSSRIRAGLFMPAVVALRHNPHIKAMCERLCARGKAKMLVVGAAMRKLVHLCYGVLKHQTAYQNDYHLAK